MFPAAFEYLPDAASQHGLCHNMTPPHSEYSKTRSIRPHCLRAARKQCQNSILENFEFAVDAVKLAVHDLFRFRIIQNQANVVKELAVYSVL